jgi:hypothetical protein
MKKYFLFLPLILFVFVGCEDVIDVNLNDENLDLFAVEAKITTEDEPYVFLYKGVPVDSDQPVEGISGAQVTISDNIQPANILQLVEDTARKGYYIVPENIDYFGIEGREYTIDIESQGITLQAKDYLAPIVPIDSMQVYPSLRGDKQFLGVFIFAQEKPGIGNSYKWDVYINDTLLSKTTSMAVANDELVDGNYVDDLEIFTDFYDKTQGEVRKIKFMDTVYVKQNTTSDFAYNYYTQMVEQASSGGLFSVQAANVEGNFTSSDGKKVLGMFTAQGVSKSNVVIIDAAIESQLKK